MGKNLNLNQKIQILTIIPFVLLSAFFLITAYTSTKDSLMAEKKLELQYVLDMGHGIMQNNYKLFKEGKLTEERAKEIAADTIRNIRYGVNKDDYIWINDFHPKMIVHPKKSLEGKDLSSFQDKGGMYLFKEVAKIAREKDSGYIQYLWTDKVHKDKNVPKLSYVSAFKPWGWILGTGIYLNDVQTYLNKQLLIYSSVTIVALLILVSIVSIAIRKGVTAPLMKIAHRLEAASVRVTEGSDSTLTTSKSLSDSTQEQAANLQQTVASVDQINAMIEKNAANASDSKLTAQDSKDSANQGKNTVDQMVVTIEGIAENNNSVMNRMEESNKEFEEILSIIKDIGNKTEVINDIVFQTKLLSFNASVEAARAGEMGKGFAVVAEEVGALASMSGKASDEISEMLKSSIIKVEEIVKNTTSALTTLTTQGKERVEQGKTKAHECKNALDSILDNVNKVNVTVEEIATASSEQSQGVNEITRAMGVLDTTMHGNNDSARQAAESAKNLRDQADELTAVVVDVTTLVQGEKRSA